MRSYDETSGQVYTETTSAQVGSMIPTWMSEARGRSKRFRTTRRDMSSLQDMALRACVQHSEWFLPETLRWAGWHYAGRLYRCLKERYATPTSHVEIANDTARV
jgi:hypothetical protein